MRYKRFEKVPEWQAYLRCTSAVFRILVLAVLVGMLTGSAGHAATEMSPLIGDRPMTLSQFVVGIVTRSADLNYVTEQDSEVFAFYRNTPVREISDTVFLELLRRPAEAQIITQSWSPFFQIRTQNDPTGRWRNLQAYLESHLTNLTVLILPRDEPYGAQYDLYAVGILNGETVVGVQMFGVAT